MEAAFVLGMVVHGMLVGLLWFLAAAFVASWFVVVHAAWECMKSLRRLERIQLAQLSSEQRATLWQDSIEG